MIDRVHVADTATPQSRAAAPDEDGGSGVDQGTLTFQPQTISIHQPWSVLAHVLKDGAPALRSLAICHPGFVTNGTSGPRDSIATVLHLIARRNRQLERISLGVTDLIDDIVPVISTCNFNASLYLSLSISRDTTKRHQTQRVTLDCAFCQYD